MIKTLLITMFVLFSNTAEAHSNCHVENVWQPGYWQTTHSHIRYYENRRWIPGFWRQETHCPPPPRRQPAVRVYVPPVFPHVRITTQHRHHHQARPHRPHPRQR